MGLSIHLILRVVKLVSSNIDKYADCYMDMALRLAQESTATRRQVGCLIVKNQTVLAMGLNGTPTKWPSNVCEGADGLTLPEVLHAEMAALTKAAKAGIALEGATLYVSHSPCSNCSKHLIACGISKVVYAELCSDILGLELLRTAKVKLIKLTR
jgi:dCMP deaminase